MVVATDLQGVELAVCQNRFYGTKTHFSMLLTIYGGVKVWEGGDTCGNI